MMMSRSQPKTGKVAPEEAAEPVAKPKSSSEHVEDLERRLSMLGSVTTPVEPVEKEEPKDPPPAFAVSAAETKPEVKAGKTALLVSFFFLDFFRYRAPHDSKANTDVYCPFACRLALWQHKKRQRRQRRNQNQLLLWIYSMIYLLQRLKKQSCRPQPNRKKLLLLPLRLSNSKLIRRHPLMYWKSNLQRTKK